VRVIESADWLHAWADTCASGMTYFDFLTAVDRIDTIDVVAHAVNPRSAEHLLMTTSIDSSKAILDSISPIFSGASWHERETAEMFGICFAGLVDARPLLLRSGVGDPPMLKSTVLAARVAVDWPGAAGPDAGNASRRRQQPPGVPGGWLEPDV
jgi:NADH-quinone oxidoreductase subunit C